MGSNQQKEDFEVRLTVLEHTVVAQNAAQIERLNRIEEVLREIHNKQDTSILHTNVTLTKFGGEIELVKARLSGEIDLVKEKNNQTSTRLNRFFMTILAIITAILGGLFSMPELFGFKK